MEDEPEVLARATVRTVVVSEDREEGPTVELLVDNEKIGLWSYSLERKHVSYSGIIHRTADHRFDWQLHRAEWRTVLRVFVRFKKMRWTNQGSPCESFEDALRQIEAIVERDQRAAGGHA